MADDTDNVEQDQAGGRKRLIIIGAAVLVLLLGGAAAAFLLLGGDAAPEGGAETAQQEAAVEEGDPTYQKLDPEFVVNLPPGGPFGMLQVAIEVMTRTPGVVDTLQHNDPMIRHHILNLLEQQDAAVLLTVEGKESLQAAIHDLLNQQLDELQAPGDIKGVFFTQFVMQ